MRIDIDNLPDALYTKPWHFEIKDSINNPLFDVFKVEDKVFRKFVDEWNLAVAPLKHYSAETEYLMGSGSYRNALYKVWIDVRENFQGMPLYSRLSTQRLHIDIQNNIDLLIVLKAYKDIYLELESNIPELYDTFTTYYDVKPEMADNFMRKWYVAVCRQYLGAKILSFIAEPDLCIEKDFEWYEVVKIKGIRDIQGQYITPFISHYFDDDDKTPQLSDVFMFMIGNDIINTDFDNNIEISEELTEFLNLPVLLEEYETTLLKISVNSIKSRLKPADCKIPVSTTFY